MKTNRIIVTSVPNRKNKCLCIFKEPNIYEKVAIFNSEESADKFAHYLAEYVVETATEMMLGETE